MVTIRDARLGLLNYVLMLVILLYIVVYQLIAKGGYLIRKPAMNSVRLALQQPTALNGKTCNPNQQACEDRFAPLADLGYCWQKDRTSQGRFDTLNCTYMDGGEAGIVRTNSIMMTTAVHQYAQSHNHSCQNGAPTCTKLWDIKSDQQNYIVDPESFTLLLDHSLTSFDVSPSDMIGLLHIPGGTDMQNQLCSEQPKAVDAVWGGRLTNTAPCYVPPFLAGGNDYFTIGYLLKSQGISLDDTSDAPKANETKRLGGLIVNMNIEYSNFHTFSWGAQSIVHYTYELKVIPATEYKGSRFVSTQFPDYREKLDVHGVLFNVQASGELAAFDMTNLLLQLTVSLGLLAVVTTIMNILAQYVLAYSPFYKHLMYSVSPDFSDLRDADELTDDQLEQELLDKGVAPHGNRVHRIIKLLENGWVPPRSQIEVGPTTSMQVPLATGAVV